jgi:hypothetical protein
MNEQPRGSKFGTGAFDRQQILSGGTRQANRPFPTDRLRPAMLIDNPKVRTVSWHAGLFF